MWFQRKVLVIVGAGVLAVSWCPPFAHAADRPSVTLAHTPTHSYVVTTTTDDTLWTGAPANTCEDTSDHSKCSLRAAVQLANADFATPGVWDAISLPSGDYQLSSTVSSTPLTLSRVGSLSVTGANATTTFIDGQSGTFANSLMQLSAAVTLSLRGIDFEGGSGTSGGAIEAESSSSVAIANCSFTQDTASVSGGAIYGGGGTNLTIANSSFTGNNGKLGGGAIYNLSVLSTVLTNDTFASNVASYASSTDQGGAIFTTGPLDIQSSTFTQNSTDGAGGAVDARGSVIVANSSFSHDHSFASSGGAIDATSDIQVSSSSFAGDSAQNSGGSIYSVTMGSVEDSTFAGDSSQINGGDIFASGALDVADSTFSGSKAESDGGSIYVDQNGSLDLERSVFTNTVARGASSEQGGGALFVNTASANLSSVRMTNSQATGASGSGGAINCSACSLTISSSTLTGNNAAWAGGAITSSQNGLISITGSVISGNTAEWGGGILAADSVTLTISNSMLNSNNSTVQWGGAIGTDSNATVTVVDSTLAGNQADGPEGYGGALALYNDGIGSTGALVNDTLSGNAAYYGGALYVDSSSLSVDSSTIEDNSAPAGSIYGSGIDDITSPVTSMDSIWSGTTGNECAVTNIGSGTLSSGGFNLVSDSSCPFSAAGDQSSVNVDLSPLGAYGGSTLSEVPEPGSPAIGSGGSSCPSIDQRGISVPPTAPCDIGSVFVAPTTTNLSLSSPSVVRGHEQGERFSVTVISSISSLLPTGVIEVTSAGSLVCVLRLAAVSSALKNVSRGTCSPTGSKFPVGTRTITASYALNGALDSSASAVKKLKILK